MKHIHTIIASLLAALALASCEKTIDREVNPRFYYMEDGQIRVMKTHLHFESQQGLDDLLDSIATRVAAGKCVPAIDKDGFTSIAERKEQQNLTRAAADEDNRTRYTISRIGEIVPATELLYVLDTNLVIGVGDRLYKITQLGTFRFPSSYNEKDIESFLNSFDEGSLPQGGWQSVTVGDGIELLNTYGLGEERKMTEETDPETRTPNEYPSGPNLQAGYGTTRYFWGWKWIGNDIFGVNQTKESYFDDTHRMKFHFWNLNFGFYATAGFKVSAEQQNKWWFITYWEDMTSGLEDVVIGINYLDLWHMSWGNLFGGKGKTQSFAPSNFPSFSSRYYSTKAGYNRYISGYAQGCPYIENFSDRYLLTIPYLLMDGVNPRQETKDFTDAIYNATTKELYELIQKTQSAFGQGKTYPCSVFVPNAQENEFTTSRSIFSGLQHYGKTPQKEISVVHYGNFIIGIAGPSNTKVIADGFKAGAITSSQGIDIFAAVKYNGKWKGINFYGKETEINSFAVY